MPRQPKMIHLHHKHSRPNQLKEVSADTIEAALKVLARKVKSGEVEPPFTMNFEGPGGLEFNITITKAEQAQEMTTMGFMF